MNLDTIEQKFLDSLVYPEKGWEGGQFVLCVAAAIGSGKTTVMSHLANKLGLVYVRSDDLRLLFTEAGHGYDVESLGLILRNVFMDLHAGGYSVALDLNAGSTRAKKLLTQLESELHLKSVWITFDISEQEAERRIRGRENIIHKDAEAALKNRKEQLERGEEYLKPLKPPVYVFDEYTELDKQLAESEKRIRTVLRQTSSTL